MKFHPDIKMRDMDLLHTSAYDVTKASGLITTIHDIIPLVYPGGYPEKVLVELENKIRRVLKESRVIIADSISTKNDLVERFSPITKKIEVIYPGRDESLSPIEDKKELRDYLKNKYGVDKKFILFVGTIEKRKNVTYLLEAFFGLKKEKKIPHQLVVIGMKGWGGEAAFELLENSEFKKDVKVIGYIQRKDMELFYNLAELFVYPSSYEGFGFPILESFSCGTPVITASTTSCAEIAGDAALTLEPKNIDGLKKAIYKVLNDEELKRKLKRKGLERSRLFSWEGAAKQFQRMFYEVI